MTESWQVCTPPVSPIARVCHSPAGLGCLHRGPLEEFPHGIIIMEPIIINPEEAFMTLFSDSTDKRQKSLIRDFTVCSIRSECVPGIAPNLYCLVIIIYS